jgi:hypothetical protein
MLMSVERSCVPVVDSRDDPVTVTMQGRARTTMQARAR